MSKRLLVLMPILVSVAVSAARLPPATSQDWPIVHRVGDDLFEGEKPFRTFGLAAPNLHQNESQLHPDHGNRFPDAYEIRDVLGGLQRIGARATRTFSLSVFSPDDGGIPVYIEGRRTYNETAFRTLDLLLALCPEYDVRVIVPIIASQRFPGWRGVDEFAALSGRGPGSFWTDEAVKEDFRHLLRFLVSRRNTVSGLLYRDDPAILAWQLGNEFDSYAPDRRLDPDHWRPIVTAWSLEMAAELQKLDTNHLVMEAGGDRDILAASPHVDVMSTHLYAYWNGLAGLPTDLAPLLREEAARFRGKRPLMADEFGLAEVGNIRALMAAIREEDIVGGLLWSIRGHRRDGGFYYHNEGGTPINSYHVPGFATGHGWDETHVLDLLRSEAYAIRGQPLPHVEPPSPAPMLFRIGDGFTWRGSTGATHYTIERAPAADGPWTPVATGLHDSIVCDVRTYEASGAAEPLVLWRDVSAASGETRYYRARGHNAGGSTDWSSPLRVEHP
jgi:hypothetical protein